MSKKTQNWAVPLIAVLLGMFDRGCIDVNLWLRSILGLL